MSNRSARAVWLTPALVLLVGLYGADRHGHPLISAALALSDTVVLDNITVPTKDGGTVAFKHVEFIDTNLTGAEVAKFFATDTAADEDNALIAKLKAAKILIPEARVTFKEGSAILRDFQASDVDAGKVGILRLGGVDVAMTSKDSAAVTVKSNPLTLEGVDVSHLLATLSTGEVPGNTFKLSKVTWAGMAATFTDKDLPADANGGNLVHINIGSLNGTNTYQDDVFIKGSGELKDLTIEVPKLSKLGKSLAAFGYDRLVFSMASRGSYDPATRQLNVEDYTLDGVNIGALGVKAQLGNLDKSIFVGDPAAKRSSWLDGDISDLELRFSNAGLFDKAVAFVAAQQHKTADEVKKEWSMIITQMVPAVLADSPAAPKIAEAIAKFIADPKTLTIQAHAKAGAISFKQLREANGPLGLLPKLDLNAGANQ